MIKLMKLELMKHRLGWYAKAGVIANAAIVLSVLIICYLEKMEGRTVVANMDEAQIVLSAFVRATFIVMAAVLIGKLIIEEYKNKTIFVMFTYPVSRKKLLAAKLLLITLLTFVSTFVSNLFSLFVFQWLNGYFKVVPPEPAVGSYALEIARIAAFSVAASGMSLITLYFGMRKYSTTAAIISSLIVVALTSSHNPVVSLANIIYLPLSLAVIGVVVAWWSIRNVERTDIL